MLRLLWEIQICMQNRNFFSTLDLPHPAPQPGCWDQTPRGRTVRCARAVRKVGHSPPPVGSFLGVGLSQGTIAIVCPCSINPPPSCMYVPLQTGTLRPVYGDTFSGCLLRGIIFCSHFSDPLLHSPWTLMLEIGCSTLAPMGCEFLPQWWGLRPTAYSTWSISKTR